MFNFRLLERKYHLCYAMWYFIRHKTIEVLLENKGEVMQIVKKERIGKIGASAAGIVGGAMIGVGVLFAVPTFGVSLSAAAAGSAISLVGAGTNLISSIASKKASNKRLKNAQFFVTFDRQFSVQLNTVAAKYAESLETLKKGTFISGMKAFTGVIGAVRVVVEEGSELALKAASKVLVAVTIPLDVAVLIYNCHLLHKAAQDETGQTDSNSTIQKLIEQFGDSLKGLYNIA